MLSKALSVLLTFLSISSFSQVDQKILDSIHGLIERSKTIYESQPDSALVVANAALTLANEHDADSVKGRVHNVLSACNSYLANYDQSIDHSFKALKYGETYRDTIALLDAYNNLGIDLYYQDDLEEAEKYFFKYKEIAGLFGDSLRLGHALNNLGLIANDQNDYDTELHLYEEAKSIFLAIGEKEGFGNTLLNIGTVFTAMEEYNRASDHYQQALAVFQEIGYASAVEHTLQSMAENFLAQGSYSEASKMANQALGVAQENGISQDLPYIYKLLAEIEATKGNFKNAFEYQKTYHAIQDSIFNSEKSMQISELQTRYETEKKQQQIELLTAQNRVSQLSLMQKRREQYGLIIALLVAVAIGGFISYILVTRSRLQRQLHAEEVENLKLKITSLLEGNSDGLEINSDQLNKRLITPLSDREFEILMLAVSDKSNSEIADQIFVSVNTVKYHLKNIYEKLGVSNRKEALQFAINPTKS
ncbi:MAG: tetratricopeptide repeat protein [Cyclobacteriaceae bacterium]